jgi:hypothetical protein
MISSFTHFDRRMMPDTLAYLTQTLSAVEMKGFAKVGSNTVQTMIPMLTGFTYDEFRSSECIKDKKHLYSCSRIIWNSFSASGYRTSLSEDYASSTIFNSDWSYAFKNPPTDYYIRPFFAHTELSKVIMYSCLSP